MSDQHASAPSGPEASRNYSAGASWRPIEMERYAEGSVPPPEFLLRSDGLPLVYRGKAHSFIGPSESMKSWAALMVVREFLETDETSGPVILIDMESDPMSVLNRLRNIGVADREIFGGLIYIRPDEPLVDRWRKPTAAEEIFAEVAASYRPALVVVDGVTVFMGMHGLDVNDAVDTAAYQALVMRRWPGTMTTLEVDHVGKAAGASALGSQQKKAGLDGASFRFTSEKKAGPGGVSRASMRIVKDREAMLYPHATGAGAEPLIGTLVLDSSATPWSLTIQAPVDPATVKAAADAALEAKVLELVGNGIGTTRALKQAITGSNDAIGAAVGRLAEAGKIARDPEVKKNPPWLISS